MKKAVSKPVAKKVAAAKAKSKLTAASRLQKGTAKAKATALFRAKRMATRVIKGPNGTRTRKVRNSTQFRRPVTLKLPRNPKYPRKSVPKRNKYVLEMVLCLDRRRRWLLFLSMTC